MDKIPSQELLVEHIKGFTETFVAKHRRQRWETLLMSNEKRWNKIDVHSFEPNTSKRISYYEATRFGIGTLSLHPHLDTDVVILRLGHSKKVGAILAPLREAIAFNNYDIIFEGVISIVPGKLAIVINHDDEATICEAV